MLVRSQSFILCIEDLHISVRGKRGALAKTTLSMPDVDPRNTSKEKHIMCSKNLSGTISRTSQSHDYANCSVCDDRLNTHVHAAKVIK